MFWLSDINKKNIPVISFRITSVLFIEIRNNSTREFAELFDAENKPLNEGQKRVSLNIHISSKTKWKSKAIGINK